MKQFANFQWDGFQGSIELMRFLDGVTDDLIEAICSIVGDTTVFIKGGEITQASGNTTITNGIILKDRKLYTFTGGTYTGTPATIKVLFEETTAVGFPKPKFVNDNTQRDIYLDATARIDSSSSITLASIGYIYNLTTIKQKTDTLRSEVDALKFKGQTQYGLTGVGSGSTGSVTITRCGNVVTVAGYYTQGSTASTTGLTLLSNYGVTLLSGFPTDIKWLSCVSLTSVNATTNLAQNPTFKQMGIFIGSNALVIQLSSTVAANATVYFETTFISHL